MLRHRDGQGRNCPPWSLDRSTGLADEKAGQCDTCGRDRTLRQMILRSHDRREDSSVNLTEWSSSETLVESRFPDDKQPA